MKKLLIVCAHSKELNSVKSKIKEIKQKNLKISFFSTWIWNYNVLLNLSRFLENNHFDFILNIWVCWYVNDYKKVFQVSRIYNLSNNKELIVPSIINWYDLESIATSDNVVYDKNILLNESYVDMESYAIELVCDSFKIPRLLLKLPVDKVWIETKNFDYLKADNSLKNNIDYEELLLKLDNYLSSYEDEVDFEYYFKNYNFTFSEKEIFKKYYYRYISLVWNNFDDYFRENLLENKKDFLKALEKFLDKYLIK